MDKKNQGNLLFFEIPQGEGSVDFIRAIRLGFELGSHAENKAGFNYVLQDIIMEIGHPIFTRTTDYDIFKIVKSNRKINDGHVSKLIEAIIEKNLLYINPILINENMEVIDGQHRLEAAKRLEIPIFYIIVNGLNAKDMASLNSNKKVWSLMDYVSHFAIEGREDYKKFNALCRKYNGKLQPSWIQTICAHGGRRSTGDLKKGKIDVTNIDKAEKWIGFLKDFSAHATMVFSSRFIEAAVLVFSKNGYNHEKMIKNITKKSDDIVLCKSRTEYKELLLNMHGTFN